MKIINNAHTDDMSTSYYNDVLNRASAFINSDIWRRIKEKNISTKYTHKEFGNTQIVKCSLNNNQMLINNYMQVNFMRMSKDNVELLIQYSIRVIVDTTHGFLPTITTLITATRVIGVCNNVQFYDTDSNDNYIGYLDILKIILEKELELDLSKLIINN